MFDISIDLGLLGITELRSGGNSLKPYTLFEHCVTLATCHTAPIHTQPSITYLSHRDRRTVSKDASISPASVGTARAAGRGRCVSVLVPSILTERTSFPLDRRTEFSRASVVRTVTCSPSSRQVCDCVRARRWKCTFYQYLYSRNISVLWCGLATCNFMIKSLFYTRIISSFFCSFFFFPLFALSLVFFPFFWGLNSDLQTSLYLLYHHLLEWSVDRSILPPLAECNAVSPSSAEMQWRF